MRRFLSASLFVSLLLLAPAAVRAADDEPTYRNKRLSEWIAQLQGDQGRVNRKTWLLALGCSASHPTAWKWQIDQREAGLLVVTIIGPLKSREVFPALLGALAHDPEERIRRGAAVSLGRLAAKVREERLKKSDAMIKLDTVRDGLARALKDDKSAKVREAAARSLGQMEGDANEAIPLLVAAVRDPDEDTQAAAAESLRILSKALAVRDAIPQLEAALKDPKTTHLARVQLAITIGLAGKDADVTLSVLTDLLKDAKTMEDLRITVAETLGNLARRDTVADLTKVLAEKEASVELRRACLSALDKFGANAKPALPELMKALHDKDKYIRTSAMHVIGGIGKYLGADSHMVVKEMLATCNDPIFEVRVAAIETLGNLGPDAIGDDLNDVLKKLEDLGKDNQRAVRTAADDAKKKLKKAP